MPAPAGYSRPQIALHWIVAVLILWQYLFNEPMAKAWDAIGNGQEPAVNLLVLTHVLAGAAILITAFWRLAIIRQRGVPVMIGDNVLLNGAARATHLGLYALMILMPISGALAWFGGLGAAAGAHNVLKVALLALVVLHVVGALYHRLWLKDAVMERMIRAQD